jgi:CheY-like chemotaxis protein
VNQQPCKVLVVDEDRSNAESTVMLLQMWGHEAEAAYSPEDAISKAKALDPDVVVIDVGRPVVSGFDLANELRRCCPDARFLAITGFSPGDIVRRTREAGFDEVLPKPAAAKHLKDAVETECTAATSQ